MWEKFCSTFYLNFIQDDGWKYIAVGLKNTLIITFFACLMGIVLGFLVGLVRSTYEKTHKLKFLNAICNVYLTVIRGTPVVVQLLIIYFVVFGSVRISKLPVAVLAFGINSGAYVAEIFRSGIMSIDQGQMEVAQPGIQLLGDDVVCDHAPGLQERAAGAVQRVHLPVKGDVCGRLHRAAGSDQGRRYYPKPHVQRVHAAVCGGVNLSDDCDDLYKTDSDLGEEAEAE